MKLFDIRNIIVSLFRNSFVGTLDYQSAIGLEPKLKSEEIIAERSKMRKQRFDEIVSDEKKYKHWVV